MLIKIYPDYPNPREVNKVLEILGHDGVVIYPTDTVYGMGCDVNSPKAMERIARIKGVKLEKAQFSLIFPDLSNLSEYTKPLDNQVFKMLKQYLPGPFTFILTASNSVPKIFKNKKKTIGIRIPNHPVILEIARQFGRPLLTTSIRDEDEVVEYTTDPELIHEKYENLVDVVIDGGYGQNVASTIVDCTGDEFEIVRQGIGVI